MSENKKFINEDTYQTLYNVNVKPMPQVVDGSKKVTPMWKTDNVSRITDNTKDSPPYSIFVATPVHDQCSIHYAQGLLEFQKECMKRNVDVAFQIIKSSLVTQGRNLCVSGFIESGLTHMLFIDSDILFNAESIFKMIERDRDVISIPYPLKTLMWDKAYRKMQKGEIKKGDDIRRWLHTYPMKVADPNNVNIDKGVIEVTHSPTGCMLIKRQVFDKMIKSYPDKQIVQKTVINGEYVDKPHMWNFFDTIHDPETKTYLGEDFSFCKLWNEIGGKCHAFIDDPIAHIGEHQYEGRFADELILPK
jgi:hypothetical protein